MIKTYLNRDKHSRNYEINEFPSETIPDQSMSIRTILERYSRGMPIGGAKEPLFQDDDEYNDLPDPRKLDLAERQEMAEMAKTELQSIKSKYPKKTVSPFRGTEGGNGAEGDARLASQSDGTELKA